jgi:hypothetical protein
MYLLLRALVFGLTTAVTAIPTVVDLGYSQYQGTTLSSGVNQYLSIRFAAPPLGDLRFRAPAAPLITNGIQFPTAASIPESRLWNASINKAVVPTYLPRY